MIMPGVLHGMQRPVRWRQPLDGQHIGAFQLQRQHRARFHRLAVHQNDAGSALGGVAADMGTGEAEIFAQQLHQKRARIDVDSCGFAVHSQGNGCHKRLLGFPKNLCYCGRLAAVFRFQGRKRDDFRPIPNFGTGITLNRGLVVGQGVSRRAFLASLQSRGQKLGNPG
jgi:hypothetical protein